jgi:hypothetical protein
MLKNALRMLLKDEKNSLTLGFFKLKFSIGSRRDCKKERMMEYKKEDGNWHNSQADAETKDRFGVGGGQSLTWKNAMREWLVEDLKNAKGSWERVRIIESLFRIDQAEFENKIKMERVAMAKDLMRFRKELSKGKVAVEMIGVADEKEEVVEVDPFEGIWRLGEGERNENEGRIQVDDEAEGSVMDGGRPESD